MLITRTVHDAPLRGFRQHRSTGRPPPDAGLASRWSSEHQRRRKGCRPPSSTMRRGGARRAPPRAMAGRPELRRVPWRSLSPSTEATAGELLESAHLYLELASGGPSGRAPRQGRARLDPPPPCRVPAGEGGERRKARRRGGAAPRSSGVAAKDDDRC